MWVQQYKILFSLSLTSTSANFIAGTNCYHCGRPLPRVRRQLCPHACSLPRVVVLLARRNTTLCRSAHVGRLPLAVRHHSPMPWFRSPGSSVPHPPGSCVLPLAVRHHSPMSWFLVPIAWFQCATPTRLLCLSTPEPALLYPLSITACLRARAPRSHRTAAEPLAILVALPSPPHPLPPKRPYL
jgi:hypothetical protein